jgi:tetratricopeptide (TPR) repeat protein
MLKRSLIFTLLTACSCTFLYAAEPDAVETAAKHYQTGLAYERLGRLDEAYTELQLACALAPDHARMALALGVVAVRLAHFEVAQRSLEHSITLDANSIASYYQLAYLYEKIGAKDRAVDSWHRFFELNQDETLKQEARKHLQLLEVLKTPAAS